MGNGCTKQVENVYFRSRKEAAKQDARLCSREGASELLGVSPSTVADYELGNTKVVPVDKVDQMAELYNCLELRTLYCRTECPIGKRMPIATQVGCLESVALRFLEVYEASGESSYADSQGEFIAPEETATNDAPDLAGDEPEEVDITQL